MMGMVEASGSSSDFLGLENTLEFLPRIFCLCCFLGRLRACSAAAAVTPPVTEQRYVTAQDAAPLLQPPAWEREHLASAMATAARYARSGARRLSLPQTDRDDLEQDILLTLLERSERFDPTRGSWDAFVTLVSRRAVIDRMRAERSAARPTFVPVDLDLFPHGASATQQDHDDGSIALDLARVADDLPEPSRRLMVLLSIAEDVSDAQQRAPQSRASFFRSLRDLRCWLRCAGLRPATRGRALRAPHIAETDSAPHP